METYPEHPENPPEAQEREQGEPLREEDVTQGDRLDDRVQEGEGLPDERDDSQAR